MEGLHGLLNTQDHTLVRHVQHCRQALEEEADILCLLAKVERPGLSFASAVTTADAASDDKSGSITVVVQEGLEVLLPMAGMLEILACNHLCVSSVRQCMKHFCKCNSQLHCCSLVTAISSAHISKPAMWQAQ